MEQTTSALVRYAIISFVGLVVALMGCSGATSGHGGAMLKKSGAVTSCGTGRASEPGAVDTVDADWLQRPLDLVSYADPIYPEEALRAGQGGRVEVQVLISPDGTVAHVFDVDGPDAFVEAAMVAIRGAEFTPPRQLYGQPVVVCARLVVSFQAARGGVTWLNIATR